MATSKSYALAVGNEGELRLNILNEICNPYSQDFMRRIGLKPGMELLEIGCGTGIMTTWLAQQVGSTGKITAIDISSEQLEIARKNAKNAGVTNIEFIELAVEDIDKLKTQFDVIYHRFILMHIPNPESAFKKIYKLLRNGGKIISEECTKNGYCIPENEAFNQTVAAFLKLRNHYKTNPDFGLELNQLFRELGLKNIQGNIIAPLLSTERERSCLSLALQETAKKIITANIASEETIAKMQAGLEALNTDPSYLLTFRFYIQICGTK